jgi:hypothetical protein
VICLARHLKMCNTCKCRERVNGGEYKDDEISICDYCHHRHHHPWMFLLWGLLIHTCKTFPVVLLFHLFSHVFISSLFMSSFPAPFYHNISFLAVPYKVKKVMWRPWPSHCLCACDVVAVTEPFIRFL